MNTLRIKVLRKLITDCHDLKQLVVYRHELKSLIDQDCKVMSLNDY